MVRVYVPVWTGAAGAEQIAQSEDREVSESAGDPPRRLDNDVVGIAGQESRQCLFEWLTTKQT